MKPSLELQAYRHLEILKDRLDQAEDPSRDAVRNLMELFWYRLSDTERSYAQMPSSLGINGKSKKMLIDLVSLPEDEF